MNFTPKMKSPKKVKLKHEACVPASAKSQVLKKIFYFHRLLRKRDSFHLANAEGEIEVLDCSFDSASLEEAVKVTVL